MSKQISESSIMFMAKRVRELSGKLDVVNLTVGEPNYKIPQSIKDATCRAIMKDNNGYGPVVGIPELLDAICAKYAKRGHNFNRSNVIVSSGAKQVIFNAFFSSNNDDDEIIILAPYWSSYVSTLSLCKGKVVIIECDEEDDFNISKEKLVNAITKNTKWIIINSPNNPTGCLYSRRSLEGIVELMRIHPNINIMSDDIYEDIVFDNSEFQSIIDIAPDLKDRILIVNGMSKGPAMAGWRVGYGIGNAELIEKMAKVQSNITTHTSSIMQYAALEALVGPQEYLKEHSAFLEKNRNVVISILKSSPDLSWVHPQGSFYIFVNCKKVMAHRGIDDDLTFAIDLLENAHVGVVPGSGFGKKGYMRLSYASNPEDVKRGCERMVAFCNKIS